MEQRKIEAWLPAEGGSWWVKLSTRLMSIPLFEPKWQLLLLLAGMKPVICTVCAVAPLITLFISILTTINIIYQYRGMLRVFITGIIDGNIKWVLSDGWFFIFFLEAADRVQGGA